MRPIYRSVAPLVLGLSISGLAAGGIYGAPDKGSKPVVERVVDGLKTERRIAIGLFSDYLETGSTIKRPVCMDICRR
ncbi:MAG: hypothetical protein HY518_05670 [Candidatus Aenigmarchaeota archaeon]|nr:hypothetical protein [Candidatus Aenigmarchaeota archaeon]